MLALALAGIAGLVIAFGLKKMSPALGGLLCGAIYFVISICTETISPELVRASGGDANVALIAGTLTEAMIAAAIWAVTGFAIWGVRKLR